MNLASSESRWYTIHICLLTFKPSPFTPFLLYRRSYEVSRFRFATSTFIEQSGGSVVKCRNEGGILQCDDNQPMKKRAIGNLQFCTVS